VHFFIRLAQAWGMPKNRPRLDWSRPLPRTLIIPKVMALATLADVQTLMRPARAAGQRGNQAVGRAVRGRN
jgi:hypothetical protein